MINKINSYTATAGTVSWLTNRLSIAGITLNQSVSKVVPTEINQTYRLYYNVDLNAQGGVSAYAKNGTTVLATSSSVLTNGQGFLEFTATSINTTIGVTSLGASSRTFFLDDIYVVTKNYSADVVQCTDYSPYGVELDQRNFHVSTDAYRYGFQGQEGDKEVKNGEGLSWNYKYRMNDPRIGRFFARDPLAFEYPHNSPYAFSENRVIDAFELEGLESVCFNGTTWHNYDGKSTERIGQALDWMERYHQGHLTAERVQNWKESWYVTIENKRDYWQRSIGTEIKFYNSRDDWKNDKPFKVVTEKNFSQGFYSLGDGSAGEGKHDSFGAGGWGGSKSSEINGGLIGISAIITVGTAGGSLLFEGAGVGTLGMIKMTFNIFDIANAADDVSGLSDGKTLFQKAVGEKTGNVLKMTFDFVGSKVALDEFLKAKNIDDLQAASMGIIGFINDQGMTYYGLYQMKPQNVNQNDQEKLPIIEKDNTNVVLPIISN